MTEAAAAAAPAPSKGPPPPPASLGPPELQSLVSRLLKVGMQGGRLTTQVSEKELSMMCVAAYKLFARQPTCIEIDPPVVICGDIHGQYSDLLRIFDKSGFPPEQNYMFLGDYVDRGKQNLETVCLLFTYKLLYPENFFLLRGNHECHNVNRVYGFYEEINRRYKSPRLWQYFQKAFSVMPLTGLIGGRILCMHGGISPQMKSIEDLRAEYRPMETPPMPSMYIDILWADPDPKIQGWKANTRGVSYTFGEDIVGEMCKTLDIDLIARAHQVVQDGYEFLADRRLVTLFSAPHYCGQFDNHAATMLVGADLSCSFNTFRPLGKTARMLIAKELAKKEPMPADNAAPQCTAPGGPEENNSDRQRGTKLQHAPKEKKEEAAAAPTPPAESPPAAAAPPAEAPAAPPAEAAAPAQ